MLTPWTSFYPTKPPLFLCSLIPGPPQTLLPAPHLLPQIFPFPLAQGSL